MFHNFDGQLHDPNRFLETWKVLPMLEMRVIACGQKHFVSWKSGLSFPAFLICFHHPSNFDGIGNDDISKTISANTISFSSSPYYYQWRSKRDFLALHRCAQALLTKISKKPESSSKTDENGNKQDKDTPRSVFPKSAFRKLCDAAVQEPWIRNDLTDPHHTSNSILQQLSKDCINGYQPFMKKSILQIDQFLQACTEVLFHDKIASLNNDLEHINTLFQGWIKFTKRQDSEQIVYRPDTNRTIANEEDEDDELTHINSDVHTSSAICTSIDEKNRKDNQESERRAAKYGQYFASDINATKVRFIISYAFYFSRWSVESSYLVFTCLCWSMIAGRWSKKHFLTFIVQLSGWITVN